MCCDGRGQSVNHLLHDLPHSDRVLDVLTVGTKSVRGGMYVIAPIHPPTRACLSGSEAQLFGKNKAARRAGSVNGYLPWRAPPS